VDGRNARVSESNGRFKLEYVIEGKRAFVTWERKGPAMLVTEYNGIGAITAQNLEKLTSDQVKKKIASLLDKLGIKEVSNVEYSGVELDKPCPNCGKHTLKRYSELHPESPVPVMPLYICTSCNAESYYLTDEYLKSMVFGHKELFSKEELKGLEADEDAFLNELKEYIIRIFASKKILHIK